MEKELMMILKDYGIPREVYFRFLGVIKEINFDDKEYKTFLIKEYKEFLSKVDNMKIDDINKVKCKTQILEVMEKYKGKSEKNNMIGKVILGATGSALGITAFLVGGKLGIKYIDSEIEAVKLSHSKNIINNICDVVKEIVKISSLFL